MKTSFPLLVAKWTLVVSLFSATIANSQLINQSGGSKTLTLQGQVTEFNFQSGSSTIELLVSDASGVKNWTITAPSAIQLRKLGWSSSSLFTGEIIRVQARVSQKDSLQAQLISLTKANGAILVAKSQSRDTGIDLTNIPSGRYRLDSDQAYMHFSFDQRGFSRPTLRFDRFSANLNFDSQSPTNSSVTVEVDVSSLSSGNPGLDQELRQENLFDTLNHPRIRFRSTSLSINAWGRAKLEGELEVKGQKRKLVFDAQINRTGLNPDTNMHTIGVSLSGVVRRSAWGLNQFIPAVSDEVQIQIEAQFVQPVNN